MDIEYKVYTSNSGDYEPSDYLDFFTAIIKIYSEDTETDEKIEIGELNGYLINIQYMKMNGISVFDVFDDYSADFENYYKLIFNKETDGIKEQLFDDVPFYENILFIDDIIIYPKYRKRKYGLTAMLNVIKTFGLNTGMILTQTLPLQYHESKEINEFKDKIGTDLLFIEMDAANMKIKKYWEKIGFISIENSNICYIDTTCWDINNYKKYIEID